MIQEGVAWETCCRSVIQRLTMSHAKKTIPATPAVQKNCARSLSD
jgi:hypothetical protein